MKKNIWILFALAAVVFASCETAESIIEDMDTRVPDVLIATDSMEVNFGASASLDLTFSDPSGIRRIDITYGAWDIVEVVDFSADGEFPQNYEYTLNFEVPADSTKSWLSKVATSYYHNGTPYQYTEYFHKIDIKVADKHLNERKSNAFVRVR